MKMYYEQYYTEHELITFIIDEDNQRFYRFYHGGSEVDEVEFDPRVVFNEENVDEEHTDDDNEYYWFNDKIDRIDDQNMLSGSDDDLDIIDQFINSGFVTGQYKSRIINNDHESTRQDSTILLFWNHYQKLNGKLITTFEEYTYYYELFYMLTQNKVGGCCPIPSCIGFDQFEKIIKAMCKDSGEKIGGAVEFRKFFRSIDEVYAYT